MKKGNDQGVVDVLELALAMLKVDATLSALDAIQNAGKNFDSFDRKESIKLFQQAALRPEPGKGNAFQVAILERALFVAIKKNGKTKDIKVMTETKVQQINSDTIASRGKRYMVGDMFNTVVTMSLKPTDSSKKAICEFQFSRKTDKAGTMDLPGGTQVKYVGAKNVYESQASSKRMLFRVVAGTKITLDGNEIELDRDIDVAGVANHVDDDAPYNAQVKASAAKKAEKAVIKAEANAVKAA